MLKKFIFGVTVYSILLGSAGIVFGQSSGLGLLREVFNGTAGQTLPGLTSNPKYPDNPDIQELWTKGFKMPVDIADNYGQRVRGYVKPPVTGNYTFWISGDDQCALYLSQDDDPGKAEQIASVPGWTSVEQWDKYPDQKSEVIRLEKGNRYYIEALMIENGGGDSLTVRWQKPGNAFESPIPNTSLEPFVPAPPSITSHPKNLSVTEGSPAVFKIEGTRLGFASIAWYVDENIVQGATGPELTIPETALSLNGKDVFVELSLPGGEKIKSERAKLTVFPDNTPPEISLVSTQGSLESLSLTFTEPISEATATNTGNYSVDQGIQVLAAKLLENRKTVALSLSPMDPGVTYTISVKGISDVSANGNVMIGSKHIIGFDFEALERSNIIGKPESIGPSSRISGLIISEFLYSSPEREDGKSLEFVEIFNTEPWGLDLDGYRISGEIDFLFPSGSTIGGRSYLVVAKDPAAIESVYGIKNVYGPWQGSLGDGGGRLRLRNTIDGLVQDIQYSDNFPWPTAADGTGHSLAMARPSFGENDARAWRISQEIWGRPGKAENFETREDDNIVINEVLINSKDPEPDFIELYNYSNSSVDLSGYIITDNPGSNKYVIPDGMRIGPKGFLSFDESELGFAVNSRGEAIYFISPDRVRVIDAFRFRGQPQSVSYGRFPDGSDYWTQLSQLSNGSPNTGPRVGTIVINEIMYNPISRRNQDEYLELHNRSGEPVDISNWRIRGDISFTFPSNTTIEGNSFVVIAENRDYLIQKYAALSQQNTFGNFNRTLSNSSGSLRLLKPAPKFISGPDGQQIEQTIYVIEDEVTFQEDGEWPTDPDGRGSSLELVNPGVDNAVGANWAASKESDKSEWKEYSWTGRLDNGALPGGSPRHEIQIMLLGAGECLIDDVKVSQNSEVNLVTNPSFERQTASWVIQGNHVKSTASERGQASSGNYSLHLRASSGGDNGANRIETDLTRNLTINQEATISAKVKWLRGSENLLLRLLGNYGELSAKLELPKELGSPGQVNSTRAENTPPSITHVSHSPILPRSNQNVTIQAQVKDSDQISRLVVNYRVFPAKTYKSVSMDYRGAGIYTAEIPRQANGRRVGFHIEAIDGHASELSSHFPGPGLEDNGIIRFGSTNQGGSFGNYHIWIGEENLTTWKSRAKLSNELLPVTFVYGNERVVYSALGRYRGSPFIRPGYSNPDNGSAMGMIYRFPSSNSFLGSDKINLDGLEPGRDDTSQREKTSFWIGEQLGVSYSYQRYIRLFVNGTRKSDIYTDSMQPDSDYIERWYPNETDGDLYKIDDWFEFNDGSNPGRGLNRNARLTPYTTSGGALKKTAYRWMWEKKPNGGYNDDYASLLELVRTMNTVGPAYTTAVEQSVDVDQWMRVFATRHIVGDWDGYGYNRGKNQSAYKPEGGKWKMLLWDLDFSLGGGSDNPVTSMFNVNDPTIGTFYRHPPFERAYLRAWQDAVDGPLNPSNVRAQTQKVYNGLRANGVQVASPGNMQSWINQRRNYLISQLNPFKTDLSVTTNSGKDFNSDDNIIELRGRAPVKIKDLLFNGIPLNVEWINETAWKTMIPLRPGQNQIAITGRDSYGNLIEDQADLIRIDYAGTPVNPADFLVINEINYNSGGNGLSFIELFNNSPDHTFDLGGMRLNGIGYTFDPGSIIAPEGFVVLASDPASLSTELDAGVIIFDEFRGGLDNDGETITLIAPGRNNGQDEIIDQVRYDEVFPWPTEANGQGPSLQLKNPDLDNRRPDNWFSSKGPSTPDKTETVMRYSHNWKFNQSGNNLGTSWKETGFNDSRWQNGPGLLYVENSGLPEPKRTPLTRGPITFYFRTTVDIADPSGSNFVFNTILDDGAIIYINGKEISRIGMPRGNISASTTASRTIGNASVEGPFSIPSSTFKQGTNVIAVEVHQTNANSSDIVWGMEIQNRIPGTRPYSPGKPNFGAPAANELPDIWLNELYLGIDEDSWLEIYNSGDSNQSLSGFFISDEADNLRKWAFPDQAGIEPNGFGAVIFGGQGTTLPSSWTVPFEISKESPAVYLSRESSNRTVVVDYIDFSKITGGRSIGSFPDGDPTSRMMMVAPTPLEPNNISSPEVKIFFTEWMANNTNTFVDPADNQFPDWFEIYNAGSSRVDISGFYLTDKESALRKFKIPDGTIIDAKSYMLFIADSEPEQTIPGGFIHTNFRLSSTNGESLILSNPSMIVIDRVDFPSMQADVSFGRENAEENSSIILLPKATPGSANDGSDAPGERPELNISESDSPGRIDISWDSETGVIYQILASPSITNPSWSVIESVTGDGSTVSKSIEANEATSFFILKSSE